MIRDMRLLSALLTFIGGKYGWEDEVGETYNFDEARERLFTKTEELASRLPNVRIVTGKQPHISYHWP